ncbi:hypothetical protein HY546_00695 [archaeon]|nr:hypothetical protein [archaeon]
MELEVKCNTIAPASNADGKRLVAVNFGVELDVTRAHATTGMPALWDNKAVFFVLEEDWLKLKNRFTVGDAFIMKVEGDEVSVRRKKG